jgi:hypothetical protein
MQYDIRTISRFTTLVIVMRQSKSFGSGALVLGEALHLPTAGHRKTPWTA